MKNYKLKKLFLFSLICFFVSGLSLSRSVQASDPLDAIKASIQAELDGGKSVAEAVAAVISAGSSVSDVVTASIEMGLDSQAVIKAAIDAGGDPLEVGNTAYNAGASLHDVYMAGASTSGGTTGLQHGGVYGVEQPTDRPASPFVPRDNDDLRDHVSY